MRKPLWYPKKLQRLRCQVKAHPLAEMRRIRTYVNGHVPYVPRKHTHQLALRFAKLIMKTAKHTASGERLVVLYECLRQPIVTKVLAAKNL